MLSNVELIERFYSSFSRRDYAGMQACYSPEIEFADAIFSLKGNRARAMWHMLCASGKDLEIKFGNVQADEQHGKAHWEAWYTFSATGRRVHNILDAEFTFQNGLMIQHRDHFDFWRWSRMALGPAGVILGWSPLLRNQVRQTANRNLEKFIRAHPEYQ